MTSELKACPFCGAEPFVTTDCGVEIGCPNVDCANYMVERGSMELAAEVWNRRAPARSDAVARLVEACKRLREHIVEQWPQGMTCSCGECAWCWETSDVAAADEALAAVEKEMR